VVCLCARVCSACVRMAVLMRGCGCLRAWVRGWTLVLSAPPIFASSLGRGTQAGSLCDLTTLLLPPCLAGTSGPPLPPPLPTACVGCLAGYAV
jgi:hypothetical protein